MKFTSCCNEGDTGGSESCNTAKKNSASLAILQKENCQVPHYFNTKSKLNVIPKPLLCLEKITIKNLLMNSIKVR